jgi:hypothetical protein
MLMAVNTITDARKVSPIPFFPRQQLAESPGTVHLTPPAGSFDSPFASAPPNLDNQCVAPVDQAKERSPLMCRAQENIP